MKETYIKISIFRNIKQTTNGYEITIAEFFYNLRNGNWRKNVEIIRNEPDKSIRKKLKEDTLPYVTVSGIFNRRSDKGLKKHSGLICIDMDKIENISEVKDTLKKDPYTYALFVSVTGTGLAVIVKIDPENHLESFLGLKSYYLEMYKIKIDESCKDISRARFVSYDPDVFVNPESMVYKDYLTENDGGDDTKSRLVVSDQSCRAESEDRVAITEYVIKQVADKKIIIGNDSYDDWLKIAFSLADGHGEDGRQYFHKISVVSEKYSRKNCDSQYDRCLNGNKAEGKVTYSTFMHYAKEAGLSIKPEEVNNHNNDNNTADIIKKLEQTIHNKTINPSQDFADGVMYYAVRIDDEPYLVTSEKELISFAQAREKGIKFKTDSLDTFRFSQEGVLKYYRDHKEVKMSELYKRIYNLLGNYIFLKNNSHRKFLSVWVIGTYVFRVFRYYPYVWLTAEKGSGKTLLMEILQEWCFNGDLSSNATEAVIFRDVNNNSITMFLDEVEQLGKKDAEKHGAIMSILNTGFSSSGIVKRAGSKNQNFAIQRFSTYSPKMVAGIKEIDDVVQDRTIKISMFKKKSDEETKRYKTTDDLIQAQKEVRDDLYIFGLQYGGDISDIYNNYYDQLEGLEHLENRELDIWEPILTLANMIDIENDNSDVTDSLSEFSKENSIERLEDNRDLNETVKLLSVLNEMINDNSLTPLKTEDKIKYYDTDEALRYFQNTDHYSWLEDKGKNYLSRILKNKTQTTNKGIWSPQSGKTVRAYAIDTENIQDLTERYIGQYENEHAYA